MALSLTATPRLALCPPHCSLSGQCTRQVDIDQRRDRYPVPCAARACLVGTRACGNMMNHMDATKPSFPRLEKHLSPGLTSVWPWILLTLSLLATGVAWAVLADAARLSMEMSFENEARRNVADLRRQLQTYGQVLRGAAALVAVNQTVSRQMWGEYIGHLRPEDPLNDAQPITFAPLVQAGDAQRHVATVRSQGFPDYKIWPVGERPQYAPVTIVEPTTPANLRALGFDSLTDPVRLTALERCRDTSEVAASGRVAPSHAAPATAPPAFILCLPVYRGGITPSLLEERRNLLSGYVMTTVRVNALIVSLPSAWPKDTDVEIFDGATASRAALVYDSNGVPQFDSGSGGKSPFRKTVQIDVFGHTWTLFFTAGPDFFATHRDPRPPLLLAAGIVVSMLLFGIAWALSATRARALAIAESMTAALRDSEAKGAGIIHSAMDAVVTIDEEQRIVMFNPAAEKAFRTPAVNAIGTPLTQFMPQRFRAAHREHVARFGDTGVSDRAMGRDIPIYGVRGDGEEFPIEASISQVLIGERNFFTVILRDISARKRAEDELRQSHRRLRDLSASLQRAREEEKTRIARELHDDLGQRLTALKMDLATLQADLPAHTEQMKQTAQSMNELIDGTVGAIRRIAADLRPVMLDDLGLPAAVEWLVAEFARRHCIKTDLQISNEAMEFEKTTATAIYRMIQEALNNVARHARASQVQVRMTREDGHDIITVADDGCGFATEDERKPDSFGLLGMRERAQLLGGTISVESSSGGGTTVQIVVPASTPTPEPTLT